jgi:alkylhydroperoxidase/carboxymuconolactone decarboxylase family protein YurZ
LFAAGFRRSHDRVEQAVAGDRRGEPWTDRLPFSYAFGQTRVELGDIVSRVARQPFGDPTIFRRHRQFGQVFGGALRAPHGQLLPLPTLDRKTRSLMNLAMLTALNRAPEIKLHVKGALNNGVTVEEIKAALLHATAYCGIPAGLDAFRAAHEVLVSEGALKPTAER